MWSSSWKISIDLTQRGHEKEHNIKSPNNVLMLGVRAVTSEERKVNEVYSRYYCVYTHLKQHMNENE